MTKRNIRLGLISMFLVGATFTLSGCTKGEEQKNTQENQEQTQAQTQEQSQTKAQDQDQNQPRAARGEEKQRALPKEAIEACTNKVEGDACEVLIPRRTEDGDEETAIGTCKKNGREDGLVCVAYMRKGAESGGAEPLPPGVEADPQAELKVEMGD